jgi:hypothetical protein
MPGAFVGTPVYNKDDTGATGLTIAVTYNGVTQGSTLSVHVGFGDSGAITCSVSDGTAYSVSDAKRRDATQGQSGQVFHRENVAAGNYTITATFSSAVAQRRIRVYEISGLASASIVDQSTGQSQTAAGTTTDSVTSGNAAATTNANDFLAGFSQDTSELDPGSGTMAAGTSYTIATPANIIMSAEGRSVSATGTYAATFTQSVNNDRITHIVAYKEAAAGGATPKMMLLGVG